MSRTTAATLLKEGENHLFVCHSYILCCYASSAIIAGALQKASFKLNPLSSTQKLFNISLMNCWAAAAWPNGCVRVTRMSTSQRRYIPLN